MTERTCLVCFWTSAVQICSNDCCSSTWTIEFRYTWTGGSSIRRDYYFNYKIIWFRVRGSLIDVSSHHEVSASCHPSDAHSNKNPISWAKTCCCATESDRDCRGVSGLQDDVGSASFEVNAFIGRVFRNRGKLASGSHCPFEPELHSDCHLLRDQHVRDRLRLASHKLQSVGGIDWSQDRIYKSLWLGVVIVHQVGKGVKDSWIQGHWTWMWSSHTQQRKFWSAK